MFGCGAKNAGGMVNSAHGEDFPTASGRNPLVFGNVLRYPNGEKTTRMGKQLLLSSIDMGRRRVWIQAEHRLSCMSYLLLRTDEDA